ncbi:MAG: Rrf2 family transcriptional regulator [Acidobacteria bacterium]|nr:Rrf2 family transcriptional regulator [Acidobacteriota bacterium]
MLSTTAEHALRALTEMAALGETESILGKELALRAGIPANYLSKVLWVLGSAGIIDATRGSGGGYRLGRKASEIRLSEVVYLFDRQKPVRRCLLGGTKECSDEDPCGAHEEWRKARATYADFLQRTTIAEITQRSGRQALPTDASKG